MLKKVGKAIWWVVKRFWWLILLIATAPFTLPGLLAKKRDERKKLREKRREEAHESAKKARKANFEEYEDIVDRNPFRSDKWGVRDDPELPPED